MNLHNDEENYQALITKTSEYMKIPEFFIEKDYWVTYLLCNLSQSRYVNDIVFKGGTSLSKAYGCIDRFSEDIDLALAEPSLGDAKRKTLMKDIEKAVSKGLTYLKDYPHEEKRGRNRKTFYEYPLLNDHSSVSPVKEIIQLEINTFTHPFPFVKKSVESFITEYLYHSDLESFVTKYNLLPFEVNVLSIERTFFEKALSLIRLSYNGTSDLRPKLRHFYDMTCIIEQISFTPEMYDIFQKAFFDDKENSTFAGKWTEEPLYTAPLFINFSSIWKELEPLYINEMSRLVWNNKDLSLSKVEQMIITLSDFLKINNA